MIITVKYVNPPKAGSKNGRLVTADGQTIWAPPELLSQFRSGMTCEIQTKQVTWGLGTPTQNEVTLATTGPMIPLAGDNQTGPIPSQSPQLPVQAPYGQGGPQGSVSRETPVRSNTGFQPYVVQGGRDRDRATDKFIFITGIVGRAMGSGKFSASEILVLTQAAAEAFDRLTKPAAPVHDPDGPVVIEEPIA
jgi:hypothetical protein